jgi:hypothetical protein
VGVGGATTSKPYSAASCTASAVATAFHITFFGTQPTLTHVPPIAPPPTSSTFGAVRRRTTRTAHAATAGTQNNQVKYFTR